MPIDLNTGHIVIDSRGTNFNLTAVVKSGGAYTTKAIKGGELLAVNTDIEILNNPAWATQTAIKWGVALGEADDEGRILVVTGGAGLNKNALIGLTDENAPELLAQGFNLLG